MSHTSDPGPAPTPQVEPGEPEPGGVDAVDLPRRRRGDDHHRRCRRPRGARPRPGRQPGRRPRAPPRDEGVGGHRHPGDAVRRGRHDRHRGRVPRMSDFDITESDQDPSGDMGVSSEREGHAGPGPARRLRHPRGRPRGARPRCRRAPGAGRRRGRGAPRPADPAEVGLQLGRPARRRGAVRRHAAHLSRPHRSRVVSSRLSTAEPSGPRSTQ